jgi:peptide/nickel transport system substrate-binding protein
MVGSGPFRYIGAERVPGARNVYAKFDGYVPRQGVASFTAGPKVVNFDRVEWITTPDAATQVSALVAGEVDYVEQPLMDLVPSLQANKAVRVDLVETKGLVGFLRFNFLFPPFDNPAIRRVVLKAVKQKDYMLAVTGGNAPFSDQCGIFTPGTPLANDAGMSALNTEYSVDELKKELRAAGYAGEKITYLEPTDVARINAIAEVGADMLRKIGMNVDVIATDWGTTVQRTVNRKGPYEGGWHMFSAFTGGIDCAMPGTHQLARGNGDGAYVGWPNLPKLEAIRDAWLKAPDLASQKKIARDYQVQAFEDVPYLPLGSYAQPVAYKASLTNVPHGLVQFTGIKRG